MELYEIREVLSGLFRLWTHETSLTRVPTGWREETHVGLVLGLLSLGPNVKYFDELPEEYKASLRGADPAAAVAPGQLDNPTT